MLGPIVRRELLHARRQGQQHIGRWIYAAWLLVLLVYCYFSYRAEYGALGPAISNHPNPAGSFVTAFLAAFVVQQFLLVFALMPAFAAGTIADEKLRGTLPELLTTGLTSGEIVAAKLLGQSLRVLELALVGLPILAFMGGWARVDPLLLLVVVLAPLGPLVALASASVLASVWSRTASEAVLTVYVVGAGLGGILWWTGFGVYFDPGYALRSAWQGAGATVWLRLVQSGLAWGSAAVMCFVVAVACLRKAALCQRQASRSGSRWLPWLERPPVGDQPVHWKERYLEKATTLPLLRRLPPGLGLAAVVLLPIITSTAILVAHLPKGIGVWQLVGLLANGDWSALLSIHARSASAVTAFHIQAAGAAALAGLILAVRGAAAISGERERQTWDALVLTPLEGGEIVRDKLWGMLESTSPYLTAYLAPALLLATLGGIRALAWTVFWWLASWVVVYFMAAVAINCSTRAADSWRSLLQALSYRSWESLFITLLYNRTLAQIVVAFLGALVAAAVFIGWPRTAATFDKDWHADLLFLLGYAVGAIVMIVAAEMALTQAGAQIEQDQRIPQGSEPWERTMREVQAESKELLPK